MAIFHFPLFQVSPNLQFSRAIVSPLAAALSASSPKTAFQAGMESGTELPGTRPAKQETIGAPKRPAASISSRSAARLAPPGSRTLP